ncbi:MAG: SUMF1/EgtB/PvdO family nonheme iron enzyme [Desulfobacterales bacterium]|nr:SUMF1/EgtB/PvdO family nonheme iron enzyme [Desulfobacterales bacterium]
MSELTIEEYQKIVDQWVRSVGVRYFSELTNTAILMEEVGEVARIMARVHGDQSFKRAGERYDLADELADVLFVLTCIANQTGIDLTQALRKNLEKKTTRDRTRHWNNPKLAPAGEIFESGPPAPFFTEPATGMAFILVPGGAFMMGDGFGDGSANELPVHEVRVDDFYMGKYPVTQGQWEKVMDDNPSLFKKGEDYPVEQVSLGDATAFIAKLSRLNQGRWEFGLPSEAQWEYAARSGGREEEYAGGEDVDAAAWHEENSDGSTHPVGKLALNGLGLYDMSGNVWEWCRDAFSEKAYKKHEKNNPIRENGDADRVIRGGCWQLDAWSVRCARRFGFPPDLQGGGLGFRLVRTPGGAGKG